MCHKLLTHHINLIGFYNSLFLLLIISKTQNGKQNDWKGAVAPFFGQNRTDCIAYLQNHIRETQVRFLFTRLSTPFI